MNFYDDVEFLREYVNDHFKRPYYNRSENITIFRMRNAKYYGATLALKGCYDHIDQDPLDILENVLNEFQIESLFGSKQQINRDFYNWASNSVDELITMLKDRRN